MDVRGIIEKKLIEKNRRVRIVYPEGWNKDIYEACQTLAKKGLIAPILLFHKRSQVPNDIMLEHYVVEEMNLEKYAQLVYELRKNKGMTIEDARVLMKKTNYLAAAMVKANEVDGEICGIEYTTKDTLKPALQIVQAKKGVKTVCSVFCMQRNDETYFFGDASLNIYPTDEELASITKSITLFAHSLTQKPLNVALLSYSTDGSGVGESVDKVKKAAAMIKNDPELQEHSIFGEIQFDAAFDLSTMKRKAKQLNWDHSADVYIFPNIDAGNIGYKIASRLGGFESIGPIVLGLSRPVNDLSRGSTKEEIESLSYITAYSVLENN